MNTAVLRRPTATAGTKARKPPGRNRLRSSILMVTAMLASMVPTAAHAGHGSTSISTGIYRIPYADGTSVNVNGDAHNHNDAYDLTAGEGAPLVAAASGWIRAIVDHHGEEPNPGDGVAIDGSNLDGNGNPYGDSLEHACLNEDPSDIIGSCGDYNNYVWIEHPNGEYTKYSHVGTGTPTSLGWSEGSWIDAGEILGFENDVGAATSGGMPGDRAFHLHWEAAAANNPSNDLTWTENGGFITNGTRRQARVCDIAANDLLDGNTYTADPCTNQLPTADAGGAYSVDEGSTVIFDGSGSSDPDGTPLTYAWAPDTDLDDPTLAQPTYTGVDDLVDQPYTLTVYDQVEAASDSDATTVTVHNVAPTVSAVGDSISEGEAATVSATFTDPGVLDDHTASVAWGDGTAQDVSVAQLAAGVDHEYGDNGSFDVTVTVVDDDGGTGSDTVTVTVANLDPEIGLDLGDQVSFPGGDFFVVGSGEDLPLAAEGQDPGSDDLTFDWSTGESHTSFNDGIGADPFPSPMGVYPFAAMDAVSPELGGAQASLVTVTVTDDDGGSDTAEAGVIVVGTADATRGAGWWKHQFSGSGTPDLEPATAQDYLDVVDAVSGIFSEQASVATPEEAHAVLSPKGGDAAAKATAELLQGWLHVASGAVPWDAEVTLQGGEVVSLLDLMFAAEQTILASSSKSELTAVTQDLARIRHAV